MASSGKHVAMLLIIAVLVAGCSLDINKHPAPPLARPTLNASAAVTATPSVSSTATVLLPAPPTPTLTPSAPSAPTATSSASATPSPEPPADIQPPLLIDGANGRIFATARQVGGENAAAVLSAGDGRRLATYPLGGTLALDAVHGWLYADQGRDGLVIANAGTGAIMRRVPLPAWPLGFGYLSIPAPQVDATAGLVYAVRDNTVYVIDGASGSVVHLITLNTKQQPHDQRTIRDSGQPVAGFWLDASAQMLYASYISYEAVTVSRFTFLSYDIRAGAEITRSDGAQMMANVSAGYLYGRQQFSQSGEVFVVWRNGKPWRRIEYPIKGGDLQIDTKRGRVYESAAGDLRVFDASLSLIFQIPQPSTGQAAGYDPVSDNLYFVDGGRLRVYPAAAVVPPPAHQPLPTGTPGGVVIALSIADEGQGNAVIGGIWSTSVRRGEPCYTGNSSGGQMLLSTDGGQSWAQPGLPAACNRVTALALSPDYAHDHTIFVGLDGGGLFKSTDGGASWTLVVAGLPSMAVRALALSPSFAQDDGVVAHVGFDVMVTSSDGGTTWQQRGNGLGVLALSPAYGQDRTIVKELWWADRTELKISRDGGATWGSLTDPPRWVEAISIAPSFAKRGLMLAENDYGVIYRSTDAGITWSSVLSTTRGAKIAFAPGEASQTVFVAAAALDQTARPPQWMRALYRSLDGGLTWAELALPEDVIPTALVISPGFEHDHRLYVGSETGQVLVLDATALHLR